MTTEQIQEKQRRESAKFEIAVQIRRLLDDVKSGFGDHAEADEYEAEILALVTDDEQRAVYHGLPQRIWE